LVLDGVERGAVGAVSGLAGALPRHVVDALGQHRGGRQSSLGTLRAGLERFPFHAAGKLTLIAQQVRIEPAVRAPLRPLTACGLSGPPPRPPTQQPSLALAQPRALATVRERGSRIHPVRAMRSRATGL